MTVKKVYNIGDDVWIYGITVSNKITKGQVIATADLSTQGFDTLQYIISIPTHIEPLLEIRSWHTMSQDEKGPIGSFREIGGPLDGDNKKMKQAGYLYSDDNYDNNDPTPDEIMAALEKSTTGLVHRPLNIKDPKPERKYFPRKKKP